MEEHIKVFAERLRLLREEKNLTLTELSQLSGVGISTLSQYENCEREAKFINILKLIRFFGVDADYIMGVSDIRKGKY